MEIKYEAVFGPQELFDGMMNDCEFIVGTYGYKIKDGKCFYCEKYNHKYGWSPTGDAVKAISPVLAMRRIIRTPTWTVADQKAGKLPVVGSKAVDIDGFRVVDILAVQNGCIVVCNSDIVDSRPCVFTIDYFMVCYKPIESPEEKAARLEDEWIALAEHLTFREIYKAQISGDLPVPGKGE